MKNILQNLEEMTVSDVTEKFNYINTQKNCPLNLAIWDL